MAGDIGRSLDGGGQGSSEQEEGGMLFHADPLFFGHDILAFVFGGKASV